MTFRFPTFMIRLLAIGFMPACTKNVNPSPPPSVWRASNDYGDKPGNGIELSLIGNEISGKFFILQPENSRNFDAGRMFPIRILKRRERELVCEVTFSPLQTDKFIIKLPATFPEDEFVATTEDAEPGAIPIEFRFKRAK